MKNPFYGKTHSPEALTKMIAANIGRSPSLKNRTNRIRAITGNQYTKGHVLTTEHKLKYSKLNEDGVRHIRGNPDGLTKARLAEKLGVSVETIYLVAGRKIWKEVV